MRTGVEPGDEDRRRLDARLDLANVRLMRGLGWGANRSPGIRKGDLGQGCFGVREGDFWHHRRCNGWGDDGNRLGWDGVIEGGFKGAAASTLRAADVPVDGDRGPKKRYESQDRDGYKYAHEPLLRITK
jgi:hypothetical protein